MTGPSRPPCDEGVIRGGGDRRSATPAQQRWVLATAILGSSLAFIEGSAVNVALPALQADLGASVLGVQWVINAYTMVLAALILAGGALGDRWGRVRGFALGVAVFTLGSLACGLAPDTAWLIGARILQGFGGALMIPGSLALISAAFPEDRRGRAIGLWSGASALAAAAGPVIGGWLIDSFSWRWVFLAKLPLGVLVLGIALARLEESRDPAAGPPDLPGAATVTAALAALTFGLLQAQAWGPGDPRVILALAGGLVLLGAFLAIERRVAAPMLPLGLFRSAVFAGTNALTLLLYAALGGALVFLPLLLVQVHGYSATGAGAALLPFVALMFVLSRWAGGLADRHGARLPLIVGRLVAACGFALFAAGAGEGAYWLVAFPAATVLGLGMAVTVAPLTTAVMGAVEPQRAGLASGVSNAISRLATVLAVAGMGALALAAFTAGMEARLPALGLAEEAAVALRARYADLGALGPPPGLAPPQAEAVRQAVAEAFTAAYRWVMGSAVLLALASAATAWLLLPPAPARGDAPRRAA